MFISAEKAWISHCQLTWQNLPYLPCLPSDGIGGPEIEGVPGYSHSRTSPRHLHLPSGIEIEIVSFPCKNGGSFHTYAAMLV